MWYIVVDQKKVVANATIVDAKLSPAKLMAGAELVGEVVEEEAPVEPLPVDLFWNKTKYSRTFIFKSKSEILKENLQKKKKIANRL